MRKKITAVGAAFLGLALMFAPVASADTMTGGFSITGAFNWTDSAGVNASLGAATSVDFEATAAPGVNTPGVAGDMFVEQANGSFAALEGLSGTIEDFTYVGTGNTAFPNPPISSFEIAGGVTVDLLSITAVVTGCSSACTVTTNDPFLIIQGTTLIKQAGFDDTVGTFNFSGVTTTGGNFAFSASNGTAVPEPTTMLLLGLGLTGAVLARRLKK